MSKKQSAKTADAELSLVTEEVTAVDETVQAEPELVTAPEPEIKPEVVAEKAPSDEFKLAPVERNPSAWNIKEEDGKLNFYSPTGRILKNITIAEFNKLMKQ